MVRSLLASCALVLTLLPACSAPRILEDLQTEAPPPELGRPAWVRSCAGVGGWLGAIGGGLLSIAVLPVTYPISLLADEPLGYSKTEFLLGPLVMGASTGHFLLGGPPDVLHFVFYRAWTDTPGPTDYAYTPMRPPIGPGEAPLDEAQPEAGEATTEPAEKGR